MENYARVAVNVPGVRDHLTTKSLMTWQETIQPGCLVEVPFGAQSVQGVVMRLLASTDIPETRPITSLIDDLPALTPLQLKLAETLSNRYLAPVSEFLCPDAAARPQPAR